MRAPWGRGMRGTVVVVAGWLAGCGPLIVLEGDSDSDAESEASTSGAPGSTVGSAAASGGDEIDDATTGDPVASVSSSIGSGILAFPVPPVCSPLEQDCPVGQGCYPNPAGALFYCAPDESAAMGAPGAPCTLFNGCDPGTFCALGGVVPGCAGPCCSPFCYLNEPPSCMPGQVCVPWYEEGTAPPGYEHFENVGACSTP
jgi:hypothetical protein